MSRLETMSGDLWPILLQIGMFAFFEIQRPKVPRRLAKENANSTSLHGTAFWEICINSPQRHQTQRSIQMETGRRDMNVDRNYSPQPHQVAERGPEKISQRQAVIDFNVRDGPQDSISEVVLVLFRCASWENRAQESHSHCFAAETPGAPGPGTGTTQSGITREFVMQGSLGAYPCGDIIRLSTARGPKRDVSSEHIRLSKSQSSPREV